jgi:hypothetical protein
MTDHDVHGCGRAGRAISVLCAFLGMVCALMMVFGLFSASISRDVAPAIIIGLIGLFVGAGYFGKKAGVFLCERGNDLSTNILVGVALAFGSIATAIATGTLAGAVFSGITKLLDGIAIGVIVGIFIVFWGAIPATVLGVLYGILMTGQLRALNR